MPKRVDMAPEYTIQVDAAIFNPAFYLFLMKVYNYEIYWGGRGSGKSKFIAQKLVLQLSTTPGRNLVAMRKQATDCRNSCFAEIYKAIYDFKLQDVWEVRENPDMRMYNRVTKSEIIFTGMDKVENVKSLTFKHGNATDLWYEELTEELVEDNLVTLDTSIRSFGKKCRVIVSFNPPLETFWIIGWLKIYLHAKIYTETNEYTFETKIGQSIIKADCLIHHSTWQDNEWNYEWTNGKPDHDRPGEYAAKLERLKTSNPYKYRTECLGLPGTAGESVFNPNKISDRSRYLNELYEHEPPQMYNFSYKTDDNGVFIPESVRGMPSFNGETLIYKLPNLKHPYVVALDTAGEGADYYAAHVMDNVTDEQVAVFHSQKLADECMIQVYGLLKMYNDALIAPEVNFSEYPIMKLKEWGYTNIYQREAPKDNYADGFERKLGFRTTSGNRQSIIDNLIEWSAMNMNKINDLETLSEMLTFTRQAKRNKGIYMGAEAGAHDDLVMALAILLKAKEQQSCEEQAEKKVITGYWTRCELEAAVIKGNIDESTAKEYMLSQGDRFASTRRKGSRYAR
jgi:phage terminase large subunit